jgi:DNA-binding NarL/FixJ family response regulator
MSISVVLADDHTVVRDGLRALLEMQRDVRVVGGVGTGREAVRLVSQLHPDVVIMDIAMPELNGVEATRQITELYPEVRVIVLSMHSSQEHVFRALQAGAHGYLLKEAAGAEVVEAVRAVCAGHHYLSQKISDRVVEDYVRTRVVPESPLATLSTREREVLQLVVEGRTSAEIAQVLSLSPKTVDTYRSRLMSKLEIDTLPELVKFAIRHGLTPLE